MELLEELFLLLEELGISAGLFYQSLAPAMKDLQSGRAVKSTALEEKLLLSGGYLSAFHEIWPQFEKTLKELKKLPEAATQLPQLENERAFYRKFQSTAQSLIQKLSLIVQAQSLSPLGRLPIQDLWEDMEQLVQHP